jgi:NAD(P) transhydrogenase subunit alpha
MESCFHAMVDDLFCCFQTGGGAVAGSGMHAITVFLLACFVGYFVVWSVTPALHAPLMSVTNAISSVIIVAGIFLAAQHFYGHSKILGFVAVGLASVNIFGGFTITHRMLSMFHKKR